MDDMPMAQTEGIRVSVRSRFLPDHSEPAKKQFLFAYEITILNEGVEPARLLTRHWVITDADGQIEEVRGDGVVGETPALEPGESFTYSSFCPLRTDWGTMKGTYGMVRPGGTGFEAAIPEFVLGVPYLVN